MWERDGATEAISHLLDGVRSGDGGSLFLIGEAGMGKSSLLELARGRAATDFRIGASVGDRSESMAPLGLIGAAIDQLENDDRSHAGRGSFAGTTPAGGLFSPDRVTPFHQAVHWLRRLDRPSLLLLDDLHWADPDSLELLVFICRRLATVPLAVIGALRPWPPLAKDACMSVVRAGYGSYRRLAPLGDGGARALVATRAGRPISRRLAAAATRQCAGNPLLLDQVGRTIAESPDREGKLTLISGSDDSTVAQDRFAGVDRVTLHLLEVASVFGERFRPPLAAEVAGLDEHEAERCLEAVWAAGLAVDADGGQAELTHPLFRQALYDGMAPPVRAQIHARAFRALSRRGLYEHGIAEHAIRGQLFGDPQAIALFERLGRSTLATGSATTAVEHLEAAIALAAGNAEVSLRLTLAEARLIAGQPREAIAVLDDVMADAEGMDNGEQARALRLLGWAHFTMGAHARAEASFREATAAGDEGNPGLAVETLLDRAIACWATDGPLRALDLTLRARQLASGVSEELRARVEAAWGFAALRSGDGAGLSALEQQARVVENSPLNGPSSRRWSHFVLASFASAATWTERFSEAERVHEVARSRMEQLGNRQALETLEVTRADGLARLGRLREACTAVGGGTQTGVQPTGTPYALARRAYIMLQMGRLEEAEACCTEAEPGAVASGERLALLWLGHVRGARRLGEGDVEGACQLYARVEELSTAMGIGEPCIVPWARDAITSYALGGRVKDARRLLRWLERAAGSLPCRWPLIAAAAGRAALLMRAGRSNEAEGQFEAALALHEGLPMPVERVRTLLDYGSFLRHHGRPARARP
ncbi:MAG TPA: AAA family ATPase, partial [Acidimicrobiales bacterium]|nr:AAA family ATPase [Acidimicrobiales bacterium]